MPVTIKQVKAAINPKAFYYRELGNRLGKHTGRGWHQTVALCPFHVDKKPGTLHVNIVSGRYHCFSCGARGDMFDFFHNRYGGSLSHSIKALQEAYA